MAFTAVKLTDPVSGQSCVMMPRDGVTVMSLDVQPTVRAVSEERVSADGQLDTTAHLSAAAVSLSLRLWISNDGLTTPETFLDEIGLFLDPSLRPNLIVSNDKWSTDRRLTVRFDSSTKPIDNPLTTDFSLSFKAPKGIWESAGLIEVNIPSIIAISGGVAVTVAANGIAVQTSGIPVTAHTLSGNPVVTSVGNKSVPWTAKLYGPATGPKLANDTLGLTLEFSDAVVLNAGDYVQLDYLNRTALLNSSSAQSQLGFLNFSSSDWWILAPGLNSLRYYPTSAGPGAVTIINYRTGWIT